SSGAGIQHSATHERRRPPCDAVEVHIWTRWRPTGRRGAGARTSTAAFHAASHNVLTTRSEYLCSSRPAYSSGTRTGRGQGVSAGTPREASVRTPTPTVSAEPSTNAWRPAREEPNDQRRQRRVN